MPKKMEHWLNYNRVGNSEVLGEQTVCPSATSIHSPSNRRHKPLQYKIV